MTEPLRFEEAAEAFLALLLAHGSRYVFINPGTDTFPLQEAWARLRERGEPHPEPVMCLHEQTALAAAHGYFLASGAPQTAIVHVDAGTLNVGGALHNAQRAEAGVVLVAGRAPYTWEGEMRGGKDLPIHFWQDQLDQAGIVRGFVKWHYEIARTEILSSIVERAFQLATNEPAGPVYLTIPREVLMLPAENVRLPDPRRPRLATPPAVEPETLRRAGELLAAAERPLIVAGRSGRDPATIPPLLQLAELLGAGIVDTYEYASVPASHPLNLGPTLIQELPAADTVLFVEPSVPYVPNVVRPAADATILLLDRDPVRESYVFWNFPADLRMTGTAATALPALCDAVAGAQTSGQAGLAAERREAVARKRQAWRAAAAARARSKAHQRPMDGEWVAWCLKRVLPEDAILVEDCITNRGWVHTHLAREEPGTHFGAGGSSIGWPPNAAIGVKLAQPHRTVVALLGDGGFAIANPVAALWTAQNAGAPFLTVIFNNAGFNASKRPIIDELYPAGAVARSLSGVVTEIDPSPDYARVAQACGAFGINVAEPVELEAALRRALDEVQHGRCAVVNAILAPA